MAREDHLKLLDIPLEYRMASKDQTGELLNLLLDNMAGEGAGSTIETYDNLQSMVYQCDEDIKAVQRRRTKLAALSCILFDKMTKQQKIQAGLRRMKREGRYISGVGAR